VKTIYFVRHGETKANVERIIAGGELESPLTKNGRVQAKQAGQLLKSKNIDLIVSSPMERTRDTATIIAQEIGYDPARIVFDEAFVEVFNGFYSGKPYALRDQHLKADKLIDDIEPPDKVHARVRAGLNRLKKLPGNNIVLVSHGATGRMIRAIAQDIPHHDFMSHQRFENTEIYEFQL
jgi:broad specificity phosphatase PhoE